MFKAIIFVIGVYAAVVTVNGVAAAKTVANISDATTAAIEAATK